jgi:hypothetical protein
MKTTPLLGVLVIATTSLLAHDPITTKVTWEREIAPLFQARCVSCHAPGGRAPMSLATYEAARPWARAIREEVLARRMPKWHVVRGYGDFRNDPSLSAFEIALITAWVDGGAPKRLPDTGRPPATAPPTFAAVTSRTAGDGGRALSIECTSQDLPAGRLLSVSPVLRAGGSLRLTLHFPDGRAEPLIWIRDFDPEFARTYELRAPATLPPGSRLSAEPTSHDGCRVGLFIAP